LTRAGDSRRHAGGAWRIPIAIIGSLVLLVAGCLALRIAASGLSPATGLATATLPPRDYAVAMKATVRLLQVPQQRVTNEMLQLARDGLETSPLAFEPFFIAARGEEQIGRLDRAIADMEEARRRRPTYAPIRMQLLSYYTRANRFAPALEELDLLLRRNPDLRKPLLPQVAKLLGIPDGRKALAGLLAQNPEWRADFFTVAAAQGVAPANARALLRTMQEANPRGDFDLERGLIFQSLAATGNYQEARQEWLNGFPAAERTKHSLLFDGNFSGAAAPRPFGWQLTDVQAGRAEIARNGARRYLDISYFGGSDVVLAEQTLALSPGRYTLRVVASSSEPVEPGRLLWRVSCLPKNMDVARLDLGGAREGAATLSATFSIPSGCTGQRLVLVGDAGERAGLVAARVERVELVQ
jgi:tetratricopeptide (TPR) repeat protein